MSNAITPKLNSQAVAKAKRIDELAAGAMALFDQAGSFEAELAVAQAMADMRAALTDDVMQPIMALMNTDLGFRTDKDPSQIDSKTGKPHIPYPVHVVRECFIESKLRGFHAVGNEWNIIAYRFYAAKPGLRRKVTKFTGISNFKDIYEVPRLAGDRGAIVKCHATWNLKGQPDSIECEIPVKVNSFMGTDAILGKAERKLMKRVHDYLTGTNTPDGDVAEDDPIEVRGTVHESQPKASFSKSEPASEGNSKPATAAATASQSVPSESSPPASAPSASAPDATGETPQDEVAKVLENVAFDDCRDWLRTEGKYPTVNWDNVDGYATLPTPVCEALLANKGRELSRVIRIHGKGAK